MSVTPPLSVLFPVRNGAATVREALDSLARQTFPSFEILAVDDGSTDGTGEILRDIARSDPRIHVLPQEPLGIVAALERARRRARGPYLARMDADDVAHPQRFERQMEVMAGDRRVVVCGTGVKYFPQGLVRPGARRYEMWINGLTTHEAMERDLFVECPLPHPTFVLRADMVDAVGGYREMGWAEDYDLVLRLWEGGGRMGKVADPMLAWREAQDRLSRVHPSYSPDSFCRCKVHFLLRSHLCRGRGVVVWGAGPVGKAFARELKRQGGRLHAFVDLDPRKIGREIHGVRVVHPSQVQQFAGSFSVAAVGQTGGRDEIRSALSAAGWDELRDFVAVA